MVGNERDKKKAQQMSQQSSASSYAHSETGPLGNTRWQVVSLAPRDFFGPYASKVIEFRSNAHIITTTTDRNENVNSHTENYRVVGSTLIINKPGYIINAQYSLSGNQLIVSSEDFRAVLKRI